MRAAPPRVPARTRRCLASERCVDCYGRLVTAHETSVLSLDSPDGTRVGCEVVGSGPPLLLVHGSTADRHRWAPVRDALAEQFTLHLMDRRGRGLSADEAPSYALEREAEDIAALLGALGPGALVLAHSYGATCALEAAAGAPFERMLAYEPAFGTPEGPVFPAAALADVEAALARGDREAALETFFSDVLLTDGAEIAAMRGTPAWQARVASAHTLAREARAANAYRADHVRLAGIAAPVRLLLGTDTGPALMRATRAAHEALPGSDLRELRGHGHAAMDADPAMFVAEVHAWLAA
jgi:pimeloyl-ACP methyl ester carboxylesterase